MIAKLINRIRARAEFVENRPRELLDPRKFFYVEELDTLTLEQVNEYAKKERRNIKLLRIIDFALLASTYFLLNLNLPSIAFLGFIFLVIDVAMISFGYLISNMSASLFVTQISVNKKKMMDVNTDRNCRMAAIFIEVLIVLSIFGINHLI